MAKRDGIRLYTCLTCGRQFQPALKIRKYCSRACWRANPNPKTNAREDVLSRIDKNGPNGCWLWTGHRQRWGYGRVGFLRRRHLAHRLVYELLRAPLSPKEVLDHTCVNPPCVNPDHMVVGTQGDNMRAFFRRLDVCRKGLHALTPDNIAPGSLRACLRCLEIRVSALRARRKAERLQRKELVNG